MNQPIWIAAMSIIVSVAASSDAGLFSKHCEADCDTCCSSPECCPEDYRCQCEAKSEAVKKTCYNVEKKPICIPPITTSPFDCLKKKLRRHSGCDDCCTTGRCDSCDGGKCSPGGLFSCFKNKNCGGIRCVNKLSKEKVDAGEKCVCEWSAVRLDGCDANCGTCDTPGPCCPVR